MISSRWPRPMGIIESIALMPVCTGSFTGWRSTTPGALNSSGRVSVVVIGGPVDGLAQQVDDSADQLLADRDARDAPRAPHRLALLDERPIAEERRADVVLLEVEGDAGDAVLELDHLHGDRALEAVDARNAITDLEHGADLGEVGLDGELLYALFENCGDLFRPKLQELLARMDGPRGATGTAYCDGNTSVKVRSSPRFPRQPERIRSFFAGSWGAVLTRIGSVYVFVDEHFFALHLKILGFCVANGETVFTNPRSSQRRRFRTSSSFSRSPYAVLRR